MLMLMLYINIHVLSQYESYILCNFNKNIYIYISQTNLYSHKNDSEKKTLHLMQQIFILQLYTCT